MGLGIPGCSAHTFLCRCSAFSSPVPPPCSVSDIRYRFRQRSRFLREWSRFLKIFLSFLTKLFATLHKITIFLLTPPPPNYIEAAIFL